MSGLYPLGLVGLTDIDPFSSLEGDQSLRMGGIETCAFQICARSELRAASDASKELRYTAESEGT